MNKTKEVLVVVGFLHCFLAAIAVVKLIVEIHTWILYRLCG